MNRNTSLPLLALLLACGIARASEWGSLGKDAHDDEVLVDLSSIRVAGGVHRAWIKTIIVPRTERGPGKDGNKWKSYEMTRLAFNCGEEAFKIDGFVVYYDDGTNYSALDVGQSWRPIPPETMFNLEMKFSCAWKPK
jgi:hypothetical protein